jgi:hypothetical protein
MVTENYVFFNSLERFKLFYFFYRRLNLGKVMLFFSHLLLGLEVFSFWSSSSEVCLQDCSSQPWRFYDV